MAIKILVFMIEYSVNYILLHYLDSDIITNIKRSKWKIYESFMICVTFDLCGI